MSADVVAIRDRLPKQRSLYDYPLPFFNREDLSTWSVTPTGNYDADFQTGAGYAIEFLKSCDGTVGWGTLLGCIVADMIRAGPDGVFPDGHPKTNGIVLGFMNVIGRVLTVSRAR